jgi:hypothetical protein
MVLVNHNNRQKFIKAYQRIAYDGILESSEHATISLFNEQVRVENRITGEIYDHVDIGPHDILIAYKPITEVSYKRNNLRIRANVIICSTNTKNLKFTSRNEEAFTVILSLFKQNILKFTFFPL